MSERKKRFQGIWFLSLAVAICALFAHGSSAEQSSRESTEPAAVPGQYVVELKVPATFAARMQIEQQLQGKLIHHTYGNMYLIQRDKDENAQRALQSLRSIGMVAKADPNYIYSFTKAPNDPQYGKLWGLHNTGDLDNDKTRGLSGVDIGAEKAWDITTGSKNVIVAVIDTGVDFKIPDLAQNAWTNVAELNGKPGVDDDGNGYIDDIHGYNFVANNGDPTDDNGHGSHCAGTIGAKGNDGQGIAGINWDVSIMAIKFLDANGSGTLDNAIKAIGYAKQSGAKILSNSWGGSAYAETLEKAVQDTNAAGQLFVAAAGNDGADNDTQPSYPAGFKIPNIVAVAAVTNRGELADFSNYGAKTVPLAAPGVNVMSTVPTGFATYSGTSMAAPHVSGVAALLLANEPNLTAQQLKERMIKYSRPLVSLNGRLAGGIVDAYYALSQTLPPLDPNDPGRWGKSQAQTVSTVHPYLEKSDLTFTVHVPGAKRVSVHFSKFETEASYDRVQFLNSAGEVLGAMSGMQSGKFSPIADGDTLILKFKSDESINGYGFDIDQAYFE